MLKDLTLFSVGAFVGVLANLVRMLGVPLLALAVVAMMMLMPTYGLLVILMCVAYLLGVRHDRAR